MSGFESVDVPREVVFVEADEPLLIFPNVTEAEKYLEATDVEDWVYRAAYGRDGQPFDIHTDGGAVRILPSAGENRPEELKLLLCRYFEACGDPADEDEPLETLVARAWTVEHDYWERCGEGRARTGIPPWAYAILIPAAAAALYFLVR